MGKLILKIKIHLERKIIMKVKTTIKAGGGSGGGNCTAEAHAVAC